MCVFLQTLSVHGEFVYSSKNPGVFTNARCYMMWIAAQYGMRMPDGYQLAESCGQSRGKKDDIDKDTCRMKTDHYKPKNRTIECPQKLKSATVGSNLQPCNQAALNFTRQCIEGKIAGCWDIADEHITRGTCDFTQKDDGGNLWDECRLVAAEGFSYNVFQCKDEYGEIGTCSNNCKGVDPNAIIIGGSAIAGLGAVSGLSLIQAAGLAVPGLVGGAQVGASMLRNRQNCPYTRPCRVSQQIISDGMLSNDCSMS